MNLYSISPESFSDREVEDILALLDAGLDAYHLRKPGASEEELADLLSALPEVARQRIVLHQHYGLVKTFGLGGYHVKDCESSERALSAARIAGTTLSRSVHSLSQLRAMSSSLDYAFLSPVFASISKSGYEPQWSASALLSALKTVKETSRISVCALGGIDAAKALIAKEMGFDGLVLHGALWNAADPVGVLREIREAVA